MLGVERQRFGIHHALDGKRAIHFAMSAAKQTAIQDMVETKERLEFAYDRQMLVAVDIVPENTAPVASVLGCLPRLGFSRFRCPATIKLDLMRRPLVNKK